MARYVMASRRAGKFREQDKEASRAAFGVAFGSMSGASVVADNDPKDPQARRVAVIDSDPSEIAAVSPSLPSDVILEPEILHWTDTNRPAELARADRTELRGPLGVGRRLSLTVTGAGKPLAHAEVVLFLRGLGGLTREAVGASDDGGSVEFDFSPFWIPVAAVVVPAGGFWSIIVRAPGDGDALDCPPLPDTGPLEWWHSALGVDRLAKTKGRPIRVGVIDTGVGPHPDLGHVDDVGAFIGGGFDAAGGADVDSHGTHVCGTIGARTSNEHGFAGIAPGARLVSARVFPANSGANQGDIANAIDFLSDEKRVDLINLSLGSPVPSEIERDAILDALERGTLCVCAAANSAGPVEFPAAFPETVAVSALGLLGWGPSGTVAASRLPEDAMKFGSDKLYLANFSCFGPEVTCAAPGVGIIATVPARHGLEAPYAAMGGTSMASPAAVGALTRLLAPNKEYQAMDRDRTRAEAARSILVRACSDIDLAPEFQGAGLPQD